MSEVIRHTPVEGKDYRQWSKRFRDRQKEVGGNDYHNRVEYTFAAHPLLNLISDWHVGHPTTRYKRIEDEINAIAGTANSFVVLMGDEIDNMHWNPGQFEQMEQTPEQIQFFMAIIRFLAKQEKLLLRISGDHDDSWLKKAGFDLGMYVREHGANTTTGPTHLIANTNGQRYVGFLAHRLPGHSMYNSNHPQMRSDRFGAGRGADFIASGHNHQKQIASGKTYNNEGRTKPIKYLALGAYKPTDSWLQKQGYSPHTNAPHEMFGAAVLLDGKKKKVHTSSDIVKANHARRAMQSKKKTYKRLSPLDVGFRDTEEDEAKWYDWSAKYPDEGPSDG